MNVKLLNYTENADRLLVFSKRTRHMVGEAAWDEVMDLDQEQLNHELGYVFNTIGSSWEFVDYTFLITNVTRAFTHQLVRHRVGVAFAQQAQRVGTQEDFTYMMPKEFDERQQKAFDRGMQEIKAWYRETLELGARAQDARGLLPTNIHTNIMMKMNLRALSDMMSVRLCIRAQGEFQEVAKMMRDRIVGVHPWADKVLGPACVRYGSCKFPAYDSCPVSQRFPGLRWDPSMRDDYVQVKREWEECSGYDPQPTAQDWQTGAHPQQRSMAQATQDLLSLVMTEPPSLDAIAAWSPEQSKQAQEWAAAVHLHASDNDDVVVPPKPDFLK